MKWIYRCSECGATYPIEPGRYLCDICAKKNSPGQPLHGTLECIFDSADGKERVPLPVEKEYFPRIPVGSTPLWEPDALRIETGFARLFFKDDTRNPTGSFKDRASVLVAAFAKKYGIHEITLASTGNAASSMAGIGAASGLKIKVFLPSKAPEAKRIQVLMYGAELVPVDGTYDDAFDASLEYSLSHGTLSRNTAYNPLTIEGKKTVSFELYDDLSSLGLPKEAPVDHVFVPVGDGVIMSGVYKGFEDLARMGKIRKIPAVWACQAEGSSAITRAFAKGSFGQPVPSTTIADSIAVDVPRNGLHSIRKLFEHGGKCVTVSDESILEAQCELAKKAGLFVEPSSACAYACFKKVSSSIDRGDSVVVLLTGSGLKDIAGAKRALESQRG